MTRVSLGLAALAAASMIAVGAQAWTPIAGSQPTWSGPVPYSLNQNGSADLGGFGPTEAVVREGMDDWTRLACTGLTTNYQGSTTNQPFQSGTAVIGWFERSWPEAASAIGVTGPSWNSSNRIVDAHMMMNGVNFSWTTDPGSGNRVNAYSIVLHEGGHYYGIGHSGDRASAMFPNYSGGLLDIAADDQTAICTLYPGTGGGVLDCTDTGCPAGQSCVGGTCVADPGGVGEMCATCSSDAQCPGLCLRYPDGRGYCGAPCTGDADCGGDVCGRTTDGRRQCVRIAGGTPDCTAPAPGPGPDPDPVPGPGAECTVAGDCGAGQRCDAGACVPDVTGAVGDPCGDNAQCDSNICAIDSTTGDAFCTQLCDDVTACPGGFGCDSGICRAGAGGLGDFCSDNAGCISGLCANSPMGPFCTRTCSSAESCAGMQCVPTEDGSVHVCAPGSGDSLPPSPGRFPERVQTLHGRTSCSAAPGTGAPAPFGVLALLGLALWLRRRR